MSPSKEAPLRRALAPRHRMFWGRSQTERQAGRWPAYAAGAFGLAMTAQVSFLLPLRARALGAELDAIGLLVGAGAVSAAATSIMAGAVVDRLGSRRAFLAGALGSATIVTGFIAVTNYWWFLPLQLAFGVMKNTAWLASQSNVTETSPRENRARATGRFGLFSNLGQMAGPVLAGSAASLIGYQWAFSAPAAYAMLFAGLGLRLSRVAPRQASSAGRSGHGVRSAAGLLATRAMQVALLLSFARLWVNHVYATFYPVLLVDRGIDPGAVGIIVATSGLIATIIAPTASLWVRRMSPAIATAAGLGGGAVGLAVAPLATTIPGALVAPVGIGIGAGLSLPLLIGLVTDAADEDARGVALGLRGMVNQTAATAAPTAVGALMGGLGLATGFVSAAGLAGVALMGALLLGRLRPSGPE